MRFIIFASVLSFLSVLVNAAPLPLIPRNEKSPFVTRFVERDEVAPGYRQMFVRDIRKFMTLEMFVKREPQQREDIFLARHLESPVYLSVRGAPPPQPLTGRDETDGLSVINARGAGAFESIAERYI